jgi:hypothetical protein
MAMTTKTNAPQVLKLKTGLQAGALNAYLNVKGQKQGG